MSRSNRSPALQLDLQWIFWRLFWFVLLVCQFAIWHLLRRRLPRGMGRRNFLLHMVVPSVAWSLVVATLFALGFTLLAFLLVKLVIGPALRSWLRPAGDPSAVHFHLAPGEVTVDSMPARRRLRWSWQPGSLVVTDRRIWFLPSAWNHEPWSASRSEIIGCDAEPPAFAEVVPVRNWPEEVTLRHRDGGQSTFAVADPGLLLAYFEISHRRENPGLASRNIRQGAFDV